MRRQSATRSAKAAQAVLEAKTRFGSVGFGGFRGSQEVDSATSSDLLSLSGEYQALLKQLSKRNASTKLKALQVRVLELCMGLREVGCVMKGLEELLVEDEDESVCKVLRQWVLSYRPLAQDMDQGVRQKTAEILAIFVTRLKRGLAPFLKGLMGPWWLAQHDPHRQTAQIAQGTFQVCPFRDMGTLMGEVLQGAFAGEKSMEAVVYCRQALTSCLSEALQCTPETIGDPQKESKEERQLRYEWVMRAALSGTRSFVQTLMAAPNQDLVQESVEKIGDVVLLKPLMTRLFSSPLFAIRSEAYGLLQLICIPNRALVSDRLSTLAPTVFNCLSEKDPACHNPMWDLLLTEFPDVWEHVNLEKAVMPKLCSLLRNGAFGSAEHSYDAVLPFVSQIPSRYWNSHPSILIKIFQSAWEGEKRDCQRTVEDAALKLLHECMLWGLLSAAASVSDSSEEAFREELINGTLLPILIPEMLAEDSDSREFALRFLSQCFCSLTSAALKSSGEEKALLVLNQVARTLSDALTSEWEEREEKQEVLEVVCELCEMLMSMENLQERGKEHVIKALAVPIGAKWTAKAFSGEKDATLFASALLRSSRAVDSCLVEFEEDSTSPISFQMLQKVQMMWSEMQETSELDVQFDLLLYSLGRNEVPARTQEWKAIASKIKAMKTSVPMIASQFLLRLLSRLERFLATEEMHGLRTEEMDELCLACLHDWTQDPISATCMTSLIRMQRTLLTPSTYSTVLHFLLHRAFAEDVEQCPQAILTDLMNAVLSPSAVGGLNEEIADQWVSLATKLIGFGWGVGSCSPMAKESSKAAWKSGQCLLEMDDGVVRALSARLQDVLIRQVHTTEMLATPEMVDEDFSLAEQVFQVIRIRQTEVGSFLEKLFRDGTWCIHWNGDDNYTTESDPLSRNLLCIAAQLVQEFGASVFRDASALRGPLFLELICCSLDSNVECFVKRDILHEVLKDIMERNDTSLVRALLEKSVSQPVTSMRSTVLASQPVAQFILTVLVEQSEDVRMLSLLEIISAGIADQIESMLSRLEEEGRELDVDSLGLQDLYDLSELIGALAPSFRSMPRAGVSHLADFLSVFRKSSLVSVTNACLDRLSVHVMETCLASFADSRASDRSLEESLFLKRVCYLFLNCFPLPTYSTEEKRSYYSTPAERDALQKLTYASAEVKDSRFNERELWRRCLGYRLQDFGFSEWETLLSSICSHLQAEAVKCEDTCEDLAQQVVTTAEELTGNSHISTPSAARHLLQRLPDHMKPDGLHVETLGEDGIDEWAFQFLQWAELLLQSIQARQTTGFWSTHFTQQIRDCLRHAVRFVFCYGICTGLASTSSKRGHLEVMSVFQSSHASWTVMPHLFDVAFEDRTLLTEIVEGIDLWTDSTGVDAVSCLLRLCFPPDDEKPRFASQGLKLLVGDACVEKLIVEDMSADPHWEEQLQNEGSFQEAEVLSLAGVHPELALCLEKLSSEELLLAWGLLLTNLESGTISHTRNVSNILRTLPSLIHSVLGHLLELLPALPASHKKQKATHVQTKQRLEREVMRRDDFSLQELMKSIGVPESETEGEREKRWTVLAMKMYHVMLVTLPVSARLWFHELKLKHEIEAIRVYTIQCESPHLIRQEFQLLASGSHGQASDLKVRGNEARREVVATIEIEDSDSIDLIIKIPDCLPLKPMSVECDMTVNVQDSKLRRWLFSVSSFLANHRGSLIDAIALWNSSLSELRQGERCIICFSILHPVSKKTSNLTCKTCHLEFHSACLYTWFRQSAKSLCPHCQSPWTA